MARINTYPENTSIEDNDNLLTYDTSASATKNTPFSRVWAWIQSKLNALTKQTAITSTDQLLMVKGGNTTGRVDYNVLAQAIIEQYNSSTLAGANQSIKEAFSALNSKRAVTEEMIIADNGLDYIEICQKASEIKDDSSAFITVVQSSGRKLVVGYQYGNKSYGAFIVLTYVGAAYCVFNISNTWTSKILLN